MKYSPPFILFLCLSAFVTPILAFDCMASCWRACFYPQPPNPRTQKFENAQREFRAQVEPLLEGYKKSKNGNLRELKSQTLTLLLETHGPGFPPNPKEMAHLRRFASSYVDDVLHPFSSATKKAVAFLAETATIL